MSEHLKEVCAYVRVSTDRQEELSPDSQIRMLKEYAQMHGMLLTHIYKEEHGISGKNAGKRPAFQKMIAACKSKEHPYDAILVWKFSRFARNIDESTYYKSILRKKCNVDVISISEPIVEGMYGRLIEMVIEWSDEFYLHNLSGEVKRGMTQKALQGGYNANAPLGYTKKKGGVPEVSELEAATVRKIFDLYVNQNKPLSDIAIILNNSGYHTKRGGKFEARSVSYILENPFYIGKIRWNYYDKNNNRKNNPEDVIISDGKHEPIISDEIFAAAGERLAKERAKTSYGKKRTAASVKHWLSGMIKCPNCGSNLGYNRGSGKFPPSFQCWKAGKGMCPKGNYINAYKAEQKVIDIIQEIIDSGNDYYYAHSVSESDTNLERASILNQIKALDQKQRRIKNAYIDGIDTIDEYRENKQLIASQRMLLEKKLEKCTKVVPMPKPQNNDVDFVRLLNLLKDEDADYVDKANAVRDVFDYFVWRKKDDVFDAVLIGDISRK